MSDHYRLLGVEPNASDEEIGRAYRRRVVSYHRRSVWKIGDRLRDMQRAYAVLADPELRRRYDEDRDTIAGSPGSSAGRTSPHDEVERIRREGRSRRRFAKKITDDAQRYSAHATSSHADALQRLEQDFDELAAAADERTRRQASWGLLLLAICLLLLVVAALVL